MKKAAILRVFIIIMFMVLVLNPILIIHYPVRADNGPITIYGEVYDSDGNSIPGGFDGTSASVILRHDGKKSIYEDPDGLEGDESKGTYNFAVTIPSGMWEKGDTYWIKIDGRGWGDLNENCCDHDSTNQFNWKISSSGGHERRDVNTVDTVPSEITEQFLLIIGVVVIGCAMGIILVIYKVKVPKK